MSSFLESGAIWRSKSAQSSGSNGINLHWPCSSRFGAAVAAKAAEKAGFSQLADDVIHQKLDDFDAILGWTKKVTSYGATARVGYTPWLFIESRVSPCRTHKWEHQLYAQKNAEWAKEITSLVTCRIRWGAGSRFPGIDAATTWVAKANRLKLA